MLIILCSKFGCCGCCCCSCCGWVWNWFDGCVVVLNEEYEKGVCCVDDDVDGCAAKPNDEGVFPKLNPLVVGWVEVVGCVVAPKLNPLVVVVVADGWAIF